MQININLFKYNSDYLQCINIDWTCTTLCSCGVSWLLEWSTVMSGGDLATTFSTHHSQSHSLTRVADKCIQLFIFSFVIVLVAVKTSWWYKLKKKVVSCTYYVFGTLILIFDQYFFVKNKKHDKIDKNMHLVFKLYYYYYYNISVLVYYIWVFHQ